MESDFCWVNFCAVKITAVMMHVMFVHCHLCKGKYDLVVAKTRDTVTIFGSSWSFSSAEVLVSLIPAMAKAPQCDCPGRGASPGLCGLDRALPLPHCPGRAPPSAVWSSHSCGA